MPRLVKRPTGKSAKAQAYAAGAGAGLPTNKKHGQHMLKNPGIVDKIVAAGDIKPSDTVFEIGPGTGNLTMKVLPLAKKVFAQEIDPRMAAEVRKRAMTEGRTNLEVREGDVLHAQWPAFEVCTANLPYQISSPFTFKLLAHRPLFRCAVLMFQKEFAERLLAKVGDPMYGRLAVNTQLFVKVSCVCKVSRGSFNPPPEVDSMVVKLVPRDPPIQVDFREWDGLMRICFLRKRKMLSSTFGLSSIVKTLEENYKTWCALTDKPPTSTPFKEYLQGVLKAAGVADMRGIKVDLDGFFKLLLEFNRAGIHFSNQTARAKDSNDVAPEGLFDDADGMEED